MPLPAWCGDAEYLRVFDEILVPIARRFQPQLILVSAGSDPHWADQISLMQVSIIGFSRMVSVLKGLADELCDGRLLFTLEGGYHLRALAYSIRATLEILLGNPQVTDPLGPAPGGMRLPNIDQVLEAVKRAHGLA